MFLTHDPMIASALVQARRRKLSADALASDRRPSDRLLRGWMPRPLAHVLHSLGHILMSVGQRLDAYTLEPWCTQPEEEWASEGSSL